jgi:hypothetical protein
MRRVIALLGMILLAAPSAQASLIGTQVTGSMIGNIDNIFGTDPQTRTVAAPGVEFSGDLGAATVEADFDANSLTIRLIVGPGNFTSVSFPAFSSSFVFLTSGLVTGVSVVAGGTVPFLGAPTLSGDTLTFTTAPNGGPPNTNLSVTLLLTTRSETTAVPAPAALALFGVALLGLGAVARRRA